MNDRILQDGIFRLKVFRSDGSVEEQEAKNLFVNEGMDYLAAFQSTTVTSVMNLMLVGTISTAATLTDVVGSMGEVARNTMATRVSAANVLTEVCTFAGDTDALTSLSLREVGVVNHNDSGPNGELRSRSVFAAVVLADSDYLSITYETTVGSR
jgi:hypothetical protein